MKISTPTGRIATITALGVFAAAVLLSGCPSAGEKPAKQPSKLQTSAPQAKSAEKPQPKAEEKPKSAAGPKATTPAESLEKDLSEKLEQVAEKPRNLGPLLVDHVDQLVRLNPKEPVWVDPKNKQVILQGEVCKAGYPLEFFSTYSNRSYEAVTSVNVTPSIVHAGLLAVGAVPGHPAKFEPEFVAPTGTEIAIEVRWKDSEGKIQSVPAQQWIRNIKTKKVLDMNWVFAGSMFITDEETGKKYYSADSGEMICVLSLPTAMLDLPILSYGAIEARMFESFDEHLPPEGTPITILLKPILTGKRNAVEKPTAMPSAKQIEAEKNAIAAADLWLKLVDQDQYSRSWETAAEFLKNSVARRDFVKALNTSRKPLGEVQSRQLDSKKFVTSVPGGPDGQYVILQYKTSFAGKKAVVETVTPMLDADKKWRVSVYYIK
jgi:hypothetical protein